MPPILRKLPRARPKPKAKPFKRFNNPNAKAGWGWGSKHATDAEIHLNHLRHGYDLRKGKYVRPIIGPDYDDALASIRQVSGRGHLKGISGLSHSQGGAQVSKKRAREAYKARTKRANRPRPRT